MRTLFISLAIVFLVGGCSPAKNVSQDLTEQKMLDVSYGSFQSSKMDVYLPSNRNKKTPFVIVIHGGGWVGGDKKSDRGTQHFFVEKGIASANINYRFVDSLNTHYPEMLADIDSAVNYCINQSKAWNTRKNDFIFMGASAGGHLSLLYAYTTRKKVNAIIAECAPVDLTDTTTLEETVRNGLLTIIEKMAGSTYIPGKPISPNFAASSPLFHVRNTPTLIIHGTKDPIVPYREAVKLHKKLEELKIPNKLITIEGAGHDLNMRDRPTRDMIYNEILAWILKYNS